ncbi:MAG: DMT family transporter [Candidatus Heimdallarchaeota archaeon]
MSQNLTRAYLGVSFAIIGWGLSTTFVEFGLEFISPLPFLTLRFITATAIIGPVVMATRWPEVKELLLNGNIWLIAIFEVTGLIFQYIGQQSVPAGLSSLLTMMNILLVPFLAQLVLKEKLQLSNIMAVLLGILGVMSIMTETNQINGMETGQLFFYGVLFLLGSATSYACYQIATKRTTSVTNPDIDILSLFFVVMSLISLMSLSITVILSNFQIESFLDFQSAAWLWIFLLAIFSTIIAFMGHFESTKGVQANVLSVLLLFQFVIPVIIDVLFLGVEYGLPTIIGSGLIIFAMVLVVYVPFRNERKALIV